MEVTKTHVEYICSIIIVILLVYFVYLTYFIMTEDEHDSDYYTMVNSTIGLVFLSIMFSYECYKIH